MEHLYESAAEKFKSIYRAERPEDEYDLMYIAIAIDDYHTFKNILDNDAADPANLHDHCWSMLHQVTLYDRVQMATDLIPYYDHVDVMLDGFDRTPLYVAAKHGLKNLILLYKRKGADPYKPAKDGSTPVSVAKDQETRKIITTPPAPLSPSTPVV